MKGFEVSFVARLLAIYELALMVVTTGGEFMSKGH